MIGLLVVILVVLALFFSAVIPGFNSGLIGGGKSGPPVPKYSVTFSQEGLPTGSQWYVVLDGANQSTTANMTVFQERNGTYHFTSGESGTYYDTNKSGNVTVLGSPVSQVITFTLLPLGSAFSWGTTLNATGNATIGCGASGGTTHAFCYSVEIAGASVTTSDFFLLLIERFDGEMYPWRVALNGQFLADPTDSQVTLIGPTLAAPVSGYNASARDWNNAPGFNGDVSGGFTVVLYLVGTTTVNASLFPGLGLEAVGENGYTGGVVSSGVW